MKNSSKVKLSYETAIVYLLSILILMFVNVNIFKFGELGFGVFSFFILWSLAYSLSLIAGIIFIHISKIVSRKLIYIYLISILILLESSFVMNIGLKTLILEQVFLILILFFYDKYLRLLFFIK